MPVTVESIHEPNAEDWADLLKIYRDDPHFTGAPDAIEAHLRNHLDDPEMQLYGGRFNGRLLAAMAVRTSGDEWCLSDLCVRSITRRRGVARSMITALERNANRAGITISATIGSEDTALLQLARKAGFQVRQLVPPTQLALERHPRGAANA
ncbi:MAG: acetyl-CoA sensor PanZ family protein [Pseudomonadota bacterium]|nr:acetyl-CoA sensor PanZ family protein [Pseudomonadota bacterium]